MIITWTQTTFTLHAIQPYHTLCNNMQQCGNRVARWGVSRSVHQSLWLDARGLVVHGFFWFADNIIFKKKCKYYHFETNIFLPYHFKNFWILSFSTTVYIIIVRNVFKLCHLQKHFAILSFSNILGNVFSLRLIARWRSLQLIEEIFVHCQKYSSS